jgi:hypothetical protein
VLSNARSEALTIGGELIPDRDMIVCSTIALEDLAKNGIGTMKLPLKKALDSLNLNAIFLLQSDGLY